MKSIFLMILIDYFYDKYFIALQYSLAIRHTEKNAAWIFDNDDIDRKYLHDIIASQNMKKLARLWINGVQFDFQALYAEENTCRRVPLPTYAFQKERYWMFDSIELPVVDQSESKKNKCCPKEED